MILVTESSVFLCLKFMGMKRFVTLRKIFAETSWIHNDLVA